MIKKNLSHIFLGIIVFVFIICKIPDLVLPYFWDELGVYAQAILYLNDHTLSVLPNSIPPELSRGHPLLFMFLYACVFKIFGTSVVIGHISSLIISITFILISFQLFKLYLSKTLSVLGIAILLIQPIFFIQSSFVLPEILLGLFSMMSLYFYLLNRYAATIIFSTLAIFVKETAIILPLVFILSSVYSYKINKTTLFKISYFFIPYFFFGIFLIIQKFQNGWFFFPYHTGFIKFESYTILHKAVDIIDFIFFKQGRLFYVLLVLLIISIQLFKQKKSTDFTITIPDFKKYVPIILLLLGAILFSSLNFHMQRYLLFIYPLFILILLKLINSFILKEKLIVTLIGSILIYQLFYFKDFNHLTEHDISYKDFINAHINTCKYIEKNIPTNKKIYCLFPIAPAFYDTRLGYFNQVYYKLTENENEIPNCDYAIYSKPGNLDWLKIPKDMTIIMNEKIGNAEIFVCKKSP